MQQKEIINGSRVFVSRVECDIISAGVITLIVHQSFFIIKHFAHKNIEGSLLCG